MGSKLLFESSLTIEWLRATVVLVVWRISQVVDVEMSGLWVQLNNIPMAFMTKEVSMTLGAEIEEVVERWGIILEDFSTLELLLILTILLREDSAGYWR
ncbi:conserved hypothetical protein [Ricinus communis]|uniref:DUF4283 domain-containing protein n=1 Tax=Ricinus communis TaxID=3988 RepID=B9SVX4_RICCO|nr:conserved hypothetical protein [Ricinus communis]